jgi:hypothetical protein
MIQYFLRFAGLDAKGGLFARAEIASSGNL